jgi:hypothetical protein
MKDEDYEALQYAHKTRGTTGLYQKITSGVVVDDNDPDQMGRLRIRCPTLGDDEDGPIESLPWAMMLAPAHGIFDAPPINSLVAVFCLDGDEKTRVYFGEIISDKSSLNSKPHGNYIPVEDEGVFGPFDAYGNPTDAFENQQSAFRKDGPPYGDDGMCGGGGGTSQFASGKGGGKRVAPGDMINYLQSKGLSRNQAIGMVNNMKYESSYNPGAVGDRGTSFGLGQWHNERGRNMINFVGPDWKTNWRGQLDFALTEKDTKKYLSKDFSTPEAASKWFTVNWERPTNKHQKANQRLGNINNLKYLDTGKPLQGASDEPIIEQEAPSGRNARNVKNNSEKENTNKMGPDGTSSDKVDSKVENTPALPNKSIEFSRFLAPAGTAQTPEYIKQFGGIPDIPEGGKFYKIKGLDGVEREVRTGYTPNIRDVPMSNDYTGERLAPNQRWWSTPGGNGISMNDDAENSRITIRSKTGNQIFLDDTNGRINVAAGNGTTWLELDDAGTLDIYGALEISMSSDSDINIYSKKSIRMRADDGIHLSSDTDIRLHSKSNLHIKADASLYTEALADVNIKSEGSIVGTADAMVAFKGTAGGYFQSGCALNFLSEGPVYVTGTEAHINSTPAAESPEANNSFEAKLPTRIPEHEPWARGYSDASKADGPGKKGKEGKENSFSSKPYDKPDATNSTRPSAQGRWRRRQEKKEKNR